MAALDAHERGELPGLAGPSAGNVLGGQREHQLVRVPLELPVDGVDQA